MTEELNELLKMQDFLISQDRQDIKSNMITGAEPFVLFQLYKKHKRILYIVEKDEIASSIEESLACFIDCSKIIRIPDAGFYPYEPISPNPIDAHLKIRALWDILQQEPNSEFIVIATINNLLQKLPPRESLIDNVLELSTKDSSKSVKFTTEYLAEAGYIRSDTAMYSGQFASRGSIIDIVSDETGHGYRIDFFGNSISGIKLFDPASQLSNKKVDKITILPMSEIVFNNKNISTFQKEYEKYFGMGSNPSHNSTISKVREYGIENWLPLFYTEAESLLEYMPKQYLCIFDNNILSKIEPLYNKIVENYNFRIATPPQELTYRPIVPSKLFLMETELKEKLENLENKTVLFTKNPSARSENTDITAVQVHLAYTNSENKTRIEKYAEYINSFIQENPYSCVLIASSNITSIERIKGEFLHYSTEVLEICNIDEISSLGKKVGIIKMHVDENFTYQLDKNLILVIADHVIFPSNQHYRKNKQQKDAKRIIQELSQLQVGEPVVHSEYGLGIFKGLKELEINHVIHDFLEISYFNDDKLYLPVENFELLSKYGQTESNIQLDKLGAASWQMRKARLRERIKLAAEVLIKTAALRNESTATPLNIDSQIYEKFCLGFSHTETNDQKRAIEDTLNDIASDTPMDRLICGDVGFGKTEVALRAAAAAVLGTNNVQVAVVVPTTLLSRQHMSTFKKRFEGWHVSIAQLSKFTKNSEAKKIKESIKNGEVDIVIGTHALLAKDLAFKNLGLVIIDEEQHFGVEQKEKLKQLKKNAHILTLSATPIPRTLQMSIVGIKELSIIATPPVERQAVKTFVIPYDEITIKTALLNEKARNGRVFYITPRIAYLDKIALQLSKLVPDMKIVIANGKMNAKALDDIMNDFYDGKYDILLSTSIIESGLDIPSANTLIIDRADMFGLAQLYQIRGRVGRSNIPAFAYLTIQKGGKITDMAEKRLSIMQSLSELGSGVNLASYDMDIRGSGNLLGQEQSGHIKEVGIELYQTMLAEAIEALKSDPESTSIKEEWSPVINLDIAIQIPMSYIADDSLRLSLYRRISNLANHQEIESLISEMTDRFGKVPQETLNLFKVVELKQYLKDANIAQLDLGKKGMLLKFHDKDLIDHERIMSFITLRNDCKLRPDNSLFVEFVRKENHIENIEMIKELIASLTMQFVKTK